MEVFFDFSSFHYHLGTVSRHIKIIKNSIIWVFQRTFSYFCEDCNLPKNCKILHFVHASKTESEVEVFFDFSSFHYHLGTVSRHIKIIKNSIIWVFQRTFSYFCEDCNLPKNCKILHFVHASKTESEVEVFFDFSSFHYHLGTVSRHIKIIKKLNNLSFPTNF